METEKVDLFDSHFKRYNHAMGGRISVIVGEQSSLMNSAIGARICRTSKRLEELVNGEMSGDWHEFVNKILIQFGDRSVGELNSIYLIFEGLSIYDACHLTNRRLTSLLQESTRAVDMDNVAFEGDEKKARQWLNFYRKCKPLLKQWIKARFPRAMDVDEKAYLNSVKYLAFDYCREFLPLGIHTRVALVVNARTLISCIHKWSNPCYPAAVRAVADILKDIVRDKMPYLLEALDVGRNPKPWYNPLFVYRDSTKLHYEMNNVAEVHNEGASLGNNNEFIYYDMEGKRVQSTQELLALRTSRFCDLPKSLERCHATVNFNSMMFGDARDFWRHRMLTPSPITLYLDQPCRPTVFAHNLAPPEEAAALEKEFLGIWQSMKYEEMLESERCYLLPMCTRVSFSWTINLRSFIGVLELRTTSNTHHNVREVAQNLARQLKSPDFFPYTSGIFIDFASYELGRLESQRRLAEKQRKTQTLL